MKKMTELKKVLMSIRKRNNENMQRMSKRLNLSVSYLSMLETGKRKVTENFLELFSKEYDLNKIEISKLKEVAIKNRETEILINLRELNGRQKKLALMFAEKVKKMSPEILKQITEIIEKF